MLRRFLPRKWHNHMKIIRLSLALLGLLWATSATAQDMLNRDDLLNVFEAHGATGTFVLLDRQANQTHLVDATRADTQYYPASTFKVANSLIALETGVIADENEVIPYGGEPQFIKA